MIIIGTIIFGYYIGGAIFDSLYNYTVEAYNNKVEVFKMTSPRVPSQPGAFPEPNFFLRYADFFNMLFYYLGGVLGGIVGGIIAAIISGVVRYYSGDSNKDPSLS